MSDREAHRFDHLSDGHLADKAAYGDSGAFVALADRFHDEVWTVAALAAADEGTATRATARAFTRTLAGVAAGISDPDACVERALVAAAFELAASARIDTVDLLDRLPEALRAQAPATRVALWLTAVRGWSDADALAAVADRTDGSDPLAAPAATRDAVTALALDTPEGLAAATADAWHEWQGIGLTIPDRHPLTAVLARLDAPLGRMGDALGRAGARTTRRRRSRAPLATTTPSATPPPATLLPIGADAEPAAASTTADQAPAPVAVAAPSASVEPGSPVADPTQAPAPVVAAAPSAPIEPEPAGAAVASSVPAAADPAPTPAPAAPVAAPTAAAAEPAGAKAPASVEAAPVAGALDLEGVPVAAAPRRRVSTRTDELATASGAFLGPRSQGLDLPDTRRRRPGHLATAGSTPTRTRVLAALAAGILTASAMGSLLASAPTSDTGTGTDQVAAGAATPDARGEGALLDDSDLVPAANVSEAGPTSTAAAAVPGSTTSPSTTGRDGARPTTGGSGGTNAGGPSAGGSGAPSGSGGSSSGAGGTDGGGSATPSPTAPAAPPATSPPPPTTSPAPPTTQPPPPTTTPPPTTQPAGPVCTLLPILCPDGSLLP